MTKLSSTRPAFRLVRLRTIGRTFIPPLHIDARDMADVFAGWTSGIAVGHPAITWQTAILRPDPAARDMHGLFQALPAVFIAIQGQCGVQKDC
jgi:hypothetical protein